MPSSFRNAYRGRFAPSPTGRLHAGSLACAMASFLDARAHNGTWIIRIEDIDQERCHREFAEDILQTLSKFGLESDEPVVWQSERSELYESAFQRLQTQDHIYGCACSRSEIVHQVQVLNLPKTVYPGTCRDGTKGKPIRSWRFRVNQGIVSFHDRLQGDFSQNTACDIGDFVIRRADGQWAYQLAVIVDDAAQGITDVVRGEDLLDNTPRQLLLQQALGLPMMRYMHIPLVKDRFGEKLSKQTKAIPVSAESPIATLEELLGHFNLPKTGARTLTEFWKLAKEFWQKAMPS